MVIWGIYNFNADPEKCYREIIQNLGTDYTPDEMVEFARDDTTELHKCFEWNDTAAAANWRRQQARLVSGSLSVIVETKEGQQQEAFKLIQYDHTTQAYRSVQYTVRNEDQYDRLKAQAMAELEAFQQRYHMIVELKNVIDEIDKVLAE